MAVQMPVTKVKHIRKPKVKKEIYHQVKHTEKWKCPRGFYQDYLYDMVFL